MRAKLYRKNMSKYFLMQIFSSYISLKKSSGLLFNTECFNRVEKKKQGENGC
jgi:hypothetical protein